MLKRTRLTLPDAELIEADICGAWLPLVGRRSDNIVSSFTFHEFDLERKLSVLDLLFRDHLNEKGTIVVADIAFSTIGEMHRIQNEVGDLWDEEEYYWCAEEVLPRLAGIGVHVVFRQVTPYAGVFIMMSE